MGATSRHARESEPWVLRRLHEVPTKHCFEALHVLDYSYSTLPRKSLVLQPMGAGINGRAWEGEFVCRDTDLKQSVLEKVPNAHVAVSPQFAFADCWCASWAPAALLSQGILLINLETLSVVGKVTIPSETPTQDLRVLLNAKNQILVLVAADRISAFSFGKLDSPCWSVLRAPFDGVWKQMKFGLEARTAGGLLLVRDRSLESDYELYDVTTGQFIQSLAIKSFPRKGASGAAIQRFYLYGLCQAGRLGLFLHCSHAGVNECLVDLGENRLISETLAHARGVPRVATLSFDCFAIVYHSISWHLSKEDSLSVQSGVCEPRRVKVRLNTAEVDDRVWTLARFQEKIYTVTRGAVALHSVGASPSDPTLTVLPECRRSA